MQKELADVFVIGLFPTPHQIKPRLKLMAPEHNLRNSSWIQALYFLFLPLHNFAQFNQIAFSRLLQLHVQTFWFHNVDILSQGQKGSKYIFIPLQKVVLHDKGKQSIWVKHTAKIVFQDIPTSYWWVK